ncbi:MAG: serine/threonine-protein kinase [Kofleriaceae bacterium]
MDSDPLLGTDIGRYRLTSLLGEGGMGRVYLAIHPMIGSRVAIKVLSDQCARDPGLLDRFFAEARAVNLIHHEGIVNVLDMAMLPDGRPYIVMEFVEGVTLASAMAQGPVPLGGLVQIATEVFSALAAAHAIGIVHRDLKPDNVLVTNEGHAKVLDFGIAKLAPDLQSAQSPRTATGALLGTPHYMAPEQITGKGMIDARTDVYAAGVMLYEAITGRRPFDGETLFDLMRAHLETPPPSPKYLRPELPVAFEEVVLAAMAKRPEDRFQSIAAMSQALQHASTDLTPDQWRSISARGGSRPVMSRSGGALQAPPPQQLPHVPTDLAKQVTVEATPRAMRRKWLWIVAALFVFAAIVIVTVAVLQRETPPLEKVAEAPPPVAPTITTPTPAPEQQPAPQQPAQPAPMKREPKHETTPAPPPPQQSTKPDVKAEAAKHGVTINDGVTIGDGVKFEDSQPKGLPNTHHPVDYDPKHFDGTAYAAKAFAAAKAIYPDAGFVEMDIRNVYPDGHADLTLTDDEASYLFRSPSHSARPTDKPANIEVDIPCYVEVQASATGVLVRARAHSGDANCKWPIRNLPTCPLAGVWAQAAGQGAAKNTVAKVEMLHDGKWFFDNEYEGKGVATSFPDRCR